MTVESVSIGSDGRPAATRVQLAPRCELGECPVWDERAAVLWWVDITGCAIHRFDPSTKVRREFQIGVPVSALVLRERGGLVVATADGFALLDDRDGSVRLVAPVEAGDSTTRMNDGKCDRRGRFWAGTMAFDFAPGRGSLYCLEPDAHRTVRVGLKGVTLSNGLAWSPDDGVMYYVDSATQRIDAIEYDAELGRLGSRRTVVEIPVDLGMPDGLTLDTTGGLWVALWGGAAVHRYRLDGSLDTTVSVPTPHVTSCTFGGPNLDVLFITTAREPQPAGRVDDDLAGYLFQCDVGATGSAPARFAG